MEDNLQRDIDKGTSTVVSILRYLAVIVPVFQIITILLNWSNCRLLAKFLNNWGSIQNNFNRIFSGFYARNNFGFQIESRTCLNNLESCKKWHSAVICAYCVIPTIAAELLVISFVEGGPGFWEELLMFLGMYGHYQLLEALEDVKTFLICMDLKRAMRNIRMGIDFQLRWDKVAESTVLSWRQLICQLQTQTRLAGEYLKPIQLTFLINIILNGTACLYLSLNIPRDNRVSTYISALCAGLCIALLGRLFVKSIIAEQILAEEIHLVEDLVSMDTSNFSEIVLKQLEMTINWIAHRPSHINLGNYAILRKQLFLGILSLVITYLIVLMQFYQTR
ncbi:unnamed protein product [Allacma fusca]|uniref:Gustatory receptor n=1 Tax=Allacma fusca TaxID=39272 RepID=A0A8J2JDT0_9HEXA|nr:unnamed protein product [Allacma fusca]